MNIVKNSNKISTLINLQNNADVISRDSPFMTYRTRFSHFASYIIEPRKKKYAVMLCNFIIRNYIQT